MEVEIQRLPGQHKCCDLWIPIRASNEVITYDTLTISDPLLRDLMDIADEKNTLPIWSQKSKFLCPTKRKKIFFATLVFVSVFTAQNNVFKLETHISMHLRLSSTFTDHLKRKEKYIEYIWNERFGQRFQKPSFSLVFGEKERFQNAPLLKLLTEVSVFISKNATKTMPFRTTTPH